MRGPALNALALNTPSSHLEQGHGVNATDLHCSSGINNRFANAAHNFQVCCGPVRGPALNAFALDSPSFNHEQGHGGSATLLQCSRGRHTRFAKAAHDFQDWCGPVRGPALNALALNTPSSHLEQGHGGNANVLQCSRGIDTRFAKAAHNFQDCCGPVRGPALNAFALDSPSFNHEQGHGGSATLLQCSSYIDTHALPRRRMIFRTGVAQCEGPR